MFLNQLEDDSKKAFLDLALICAKADEDFDDKEAILKLLDGADFKFYLEFLMVVSLNPNKFSNEIKKELEEKLNLSENIISLSNNWAINTASHINNAIKIIDSVNQ